MGPSKPKTRSWWNCTPFNPLSEGVCFSHSPWSLPFESSPCGIFRFSTLSPSFLSLTHHVIAEVCDHASEHFHCLEDILLNSTQQKAQPVALVIQRHLFTLLGFKRLTAFGSRYCPYRTTFIANIKFILLEKTWVSQGKTTKQLRLSFDKWVEPLSKN